MYVGTGYALLVDASASETNRVQITNFGDTLYYGTDSTVSASNNIGSLADGASVTLERTTWIRSSGKSQVQVTSRDSIASQTELDAVEAKALEHTPAAGSIELAQLSTALSERLPNFAAVTEEQSLTKENTTPQEITQLTFEINTSATQVWAGFYLPVFEGADTEADLKMELTGPSGASGYWGAIYGANASSPGWQATAEANTPGELQALNNSTKFGSRAGKFGIPIFAIVRGGGTAGKVSLKASQNTSKSSTTKVLANSSRVMFKIAA